MSLYLMQLSIDPAALLQFGRQEGVLRYDATGTDYLLHCWLISLFGVRAPKPFRYFEKEHKLLGYAKDDAKTLLETAKSFATPLAYTALREESLATKPMPRMWRDGLRIRMEVLACPVSRKEGTEKDVYLRALDRWGSGAPPRFEVYTGWFVRQWGTAVAFEKIAVHGFVRTRTVRRIHENGGRQLRVVEHPSVIFRATAGIVDGEAFAALLARGIGRHRSFGYGMVLLAPAGAAP